MKKRDLPRASFDLRDFPEFDTHQAVISFVDPETSLRGFIAIHNTNVGPAVGGTRFHYYPTEADALRDALRLSRAMTYKCALANVPYGGGKAVLMAPSISRKAHQLKTEKFWNSYAKKIGLLEGNFFTGEDVGITERDIKILEKHSPYIIGRPSVGSLPAHWAALSVFESMRAALQVVFGTSSFEGRTVAIKGLGNAGKDLAGMLVHAGAKVIGAEIDKKRLQDARREIPELVGVSPEHILFQEADILSPCALGDDLTRQTIPRLKAKIVCGAANNQCATPEDGERLHKRGIVYVPDYVANGGGLINVVDELQKGGYNPSRVQRNVKQVYDTVLELLRHAKKHHVSPYSYADRLAEKRFRKA